MRCGVQRCEVGGNNLETINGMTCEIISYAIGVSHTFLRQYVEASTGTQGAKDHGITQICGKRGNRSKAGGVRQRQMLQDTVQIVAELLVLDSHSLGYSRRP